MAQPKKTITPEVRLMAFALFTMAQQHARQSRTFETQLSELLSYEDTWAGAISDEIYDPNGRFEVGLKKDGFAVRPTPKRKRR